MNRAMHSIGQCTSEPLLAALLILWALLTAAAPGWAAGPPQPGQIVRNANYPQWLMHHGGDPLFICGAGDPEGFLYRGTRRADGTRNGDQVALINKLVANGGNAIYLQGIRSHGGDGGASENPYVNANVAGSIDHDILDQWETWFSLMDRHNILIYFFFYDDSANPFGDGANVPAAEENYIRTIVDRFEHHKNLIWLVGEEAHESYPPTRVRNIANRIDYHDDYSHLIGSHDDSRTDFQAWSSDSKLSHYSMQWNHAASTLVHDGAKRAFDQAVAAGNEGNGYLAIYAENVERQGNDVNDVRDMIWESAMGGLQVMRLGMDIQNTPPQALNSCRILQTFFEATNFYTMRHADDLAYSNTQYVLSNRDRSHIAYSKQAGAGLGLRELAPGNYDLLWIDAIDGDVVTQRNVAASGTTIFPRPATISAQTAVWVTMNDSAAHPAPPQAPTLLSMRQID